MKNAGPNSATSSLPITLVGHEKETQILRDKISRFASGTFLLTGPSGIGKRLAVWSLLKEFLCDKGQSCGNGCPSCLGLQKHQHISVLEILPESTMITIEDVEKIFQFVNLKGLSRKQFVIMDDVHLLNTQSANKLLKTLEEPPENVFFILITPQKSRVLKTILSRSQIIRFAPLTQEQLHQIFPRTSEQLLMMARGSAARVLELEDPEYQMKLSAAKKVWKELSQPDFLVESSWREEWKGREAFETLLKGWEMELVEQVFGNSKSRSREEMAMNAELFQEIQKLRDFVLTRNSDPTLSLESFWVRIQKFHGNISL